MITAAESPDPAPPAARVFNPQGQAPAVLVCEHASRFIPAALNGLGLSEAAANSHAAWDIGALDLSQALMRTLDAPLVASGISRLAYDCNRPPEAASAIPVQSEVFTIPGNADLTARQRAARVAGIYEPFRALLRQVLDQHPVPPLMITIHSFTPVFNGVRRETELGILHDSDARAAHMLLDSVQRHTKLNAALNQPYSASDGVTHTLRTMAQTRGLANVMLELRNDLIDHPEGVDAIAAQLGPLLHDLAAHFASLHNGTDNADRTAGKAG